MNNDQNFNAYGAKLLYLSVVIPCYKEQDSLPILFKRLIPVLDQLQKPYEVILVNDGSVDKTGEVAAELFIKHPDVVRVIEFNRNYGQHMAIMAGFEHVRGEVIVTLGADLQNFPEDIPLLLAKIEEGYDVVGGYCIDRKDRFWRKLFSHGFSILRLKLTKINLRDEGCMLRAYRRNIIDQMVACEEHSTFVPALAASLARNAIDVPVRHNAATDTKTAHQSVYQLIRYNFDFFTNFSRAPLEMFTILGFFIALGSFALFIYIMAQRFMYGADADGVFTLFAIMYFLVGILLMGLGIVGEYIGRIYEEVRKRPRYIVKSVLEKK